MKPLNEMTLADIEKVKMIVFDVDGVLVPRGTKIKQIGNTTTLETKIIARKQIEQIKALHEKGFIMNISSGRGLYMLQEMFHEILPFTSLTFENGSATWNAGKIYQHINSFEKLWRVYPKLRAVTDKHSEFKGYEPKEFIITVHCTEQVKEIEDVVASEPDLYTVWNGEAYDIGIKDEQTKALGLKRVREIFFLNKDNVMAMGDNFNDAELLNESGLPISADKTRVEGKFFIPLEGEFLPADNLMQKILELKS